MDLSDRIAIETGICNKDSFKKIAKLLKRHPSTIAHEVKENRTFIRGNYPNGKDCRYVRTRNVHHLCGDPECDKNCCKCWKFYCVEKCPVYVSAACHKFESPPYVCNSCPDKKLCTKDKFIYSAKHADAAVTRRRSESRQGIRVTEAQMADMNSLIAKLVKKGQPLAHIYAEHEDEIPVSLRTLYTYEDFEKAMESTYSGYSVVDMDTVKGVREKGKRLLTMIFRDNNIMLLFLMPDGTAESVKRVFDYLETGLGTDVFQRLFPVILTDNGSEFKNVKELELSETLEYRTHLYFCDPMASWQKGCIEKNHEFIRYVLPKGKSLNPYTQDDITLLMNHMNSVIRPGLGNKCPYDLVDNHDEDMKKLMALLKMHSIPADEVHLKPDLFTKK